MRSLIWATHFRFPKMRDENKREDKGMKKIATLILALSVCFILCGCSNANRTKLAGEYGTETMLGAGSDYENLIIERYLFDNAGNVAYYRDSSFSDSEAHKLRIKIGKYSMDKEFITITFETISVIDGNKKAIVEKEQNESEKIPYYINEYTHEIMIYPNTDGETEYTYYGELSKPINIIIDEIKAQQCSNWDS